MIHGILQFTLRIAFRCVLHRCESQEIRCQKLFSFHFKRRIRFGSLERAETRSRNSIGAQVYRLSSIGNDPTAGSPTVTLLRLLLPLNDQV